MYFTITSFLFLSSLFITLIQCENLTINPVSNDIEICLCDRKKDSCDVSCCCDKDCSRNDLEAFNCLAKTDENIKPKPTGQSTCFKDISIYKSNAPYVVQKKDNLVCVDYERDYSSQEQLINQKIDTNAFSRSINVDNSVASSTGTPINLTQYQVGTSIFRYISSSNTTSYYSLPIQSFNSRFCSGFQPITYLNNFTSTCIQQVTEETCGNALDSKKYIPQFCLIKNPTSLRNLSVIPICCTGSGSSTSWSNPTCTNALQTLNIIIYYTNPDGIDSCNITISTTPSSSSTVEQTFNIDFVKTGSTASITSRSGNPGYLQGAPVISGILSGSSIITSDFTLPQALTSGLCSTTSGTTIRFGQNLQSTCISGNSISPSCPNITDPLNVLMPFTSLTRYVAAKGNPSLSNINDWQPVTFCTSVIGSNKDPECGTSIRNSSSNQCYKRLDIQISYANVGSVINPQPVIGAVVFHYQSVSVASTTAYTTPLLITHTVTFRDISNAPSTEGDHIPRPNTRLLGDFFYPFSLNRATNSLSFPLFVYLLSSFLCILM